MLMDTFMTALVEPVIASALAECIDKMQENWKLTGYPVIVLGTTSQSSRVPIGVLSSFKHEVPFEVIISLLLVELC